VTTRAVRGARAAVGETTTSATAVVALVTVTGPSSPGAAPPTEISSPSEARVCPAAQCVFEPVSVTLRLCPCVAREGLTELRAAGSACVRVAVNVMIT
jgi:hypothetical protein